MSQKCSAIQEEPAPYRFTVKEWHRLGETGFFEESERVELLNGEIIAMSPIGSRHAIAAYNLNDVLGEQNRRRYLIGMGNPVEADEFSESLPDLMLVPRSQKLARRHPLTREAFLLVEIADSSLSHDRGCKLRKYAQTGVQEYWIVNLQDDVIEVNRAPQGESYMEQSVVTMGETVAPLAFPDVIVEVAEIIPPR